jgi:Raf kinase inhibitor-like YbhB/YbcL family protein
MAEMGFTVTCPAFLQGGLIPVIHAYDSKNTSPALQWSHTPPDTRSFVLLMEDADTRDGTLTHWVLFDIPGSAQGLAEQEASLGMPGRNDFQGEGYAGPCPPPRSGVHRYVLRLYALDVESLGLQRGATRRDVENAMRGHILDNAELMGLYERG